MRNARPEAAHALQWYGPRPKREAHTPPTRVSERGSAALPGCNLCPGIPVDEIAAGDSNGAAADSYRDDAAQPSSQHPDPDAGEVQKPRRDHEPNRESESISGGRQFDAVP